jgi:sigma-B regulation protein RsbU (phosphoserine phosphatase)
MFDTPRYFEGFAELAEGDLMVLYTDGIDESSNAHDEQYGRSRLMTTIGSVRTQSAEAICRHVMDDVRTFSFGSQDDRTLVVMKAV